MTHQDIKDDLALHALGSLDREEGDAVERHLAEGCTECERELAEWRRVAALLPLGSDDAESPELKGRLLARARGRRPATVLSFRRRLVLPLAAAALIAFAVTSELGHRRERATANAERARLERALAAAESDLGKLTAELASREQDLGNLRRALADAEQSLSMLRARGLTMVSLRQPPDAPAAEAHLLLSGASGKGALYAFDLAAVPADKVYELWWITERQGPIMAGLFRPDERGLGRLEAALPADAGRIQAAAVTIEPAAGVPKPTGRMVLIGELKS